MGWRPLLGRLKRRSSRCSRRLHTLAASAVLRGQACPGDTRPASWSDSQTRPAPFAHALSARFSRTASSVAAGETSRRERPAPPTIKSGDVDAIGAWRTRAAQKAARARVLCTRGQGSGGRMILRTCVRERAAEPQHPRRHPSRPTGYRSFGDVECTPR